MYMKIAAAIAASVLVLAVLVGYSAKAVVESLFGGSSTANCAAQIADIPPDYCVLYLAAAPNCPGLDWSVLAAIGKVETDHGRSTLPGVHDGQNFAGAGGPMQFLSSTFNNVVAAHQLPPGGANPPSRYNPHDAIHAAAFLLCDEGVRRGDLRVAIFAYNHANWYVDEVLDQAAKYAEAAASAGSGDCKNVAALNVVVLKAINYACKHLGWRVCRTASSLSSGRVVHRLDQLARTLKSVRRVPEVATFLAIQGAGAHGVDAEEGRTVTWPV